MHRLMEFISRGMAYLGGIVLSILIILTCVSVTGRTLNGWLHDDFLQGLAPGFADWLLARGIGPINGDFEIVEAGIAFAIFAFLPLCQITAGHASVDIFTSFLPARVQRTMRAVTEVVFALVLVLIAWRLYEGLLSKHQNGETSWLLQFPIWWAYAASFFGSVMAAIVGVYMAGVRIAEAATGREIIAESKGDDLEAKA